MFGRGEFLQKKSVASVVWCHLSSPLSPGCKSRGPGSAQPKGESPFLPLSIAKLTVSQGYDCSDVIGQDLREECIKLKMLVFDLERQNRALCELFQQKLPNQPAAHFQVASPVLTDRCPASSVLACFTSCSGADGDLGQGCV